MADDRSNPVSDEFETAATPAFSGTGGPDEEPGLPPRLRQIGQYHIKRIIASGGMGSVYEAMQEHPRRKVALKVMRSGITSRSALRRFEFESQLLGRLRHPGIAQVYEAGTHDDGTGSVPYFAMEYISGARTITEYAQARDLATRQRLELFIHLCEAVYHGHQKGIIHRDLKPGNVLVDSTGQVKIIDYGVARATDSDLAVTTLQTSVGDLVGTVQYMSPEQCDADPHDLDTRSDVYALGVLLYQLLCNSLPYDVSSLAIFEATRVIREKSPIPMGPIRSELKGDVETIVRKAMEKERDRRYQSAAELGRDIQRHLNNEPILGRPPSVAYQLSKFARRNKLAVGALTAVFVALVIGVILALSGKHQAEIANRRAQQEARIAQAITRYFQNMFTSVSARDAYGPNAKVADLLDEFAESIEASVGDEPEVQAALRSSLGRGYKALSLFDRAEPQLRAALANQLKIHPEPHADAAQILLDLGGVLWWEQRYDEAEGTIREALAMYDALHGSTHENVARAVDFLAACRSRQGHEQEAEELYRQVLAMRQELFGPRHELVARTMNNLAECLMSQDRLDDAEQLFRDAIGIVQETRQGEHIDVARGMSNLGRCLLAQERLDEAELYLRDALAMKRRLLREDHTSLAITMGYLADLLHRTEANAEAEQLCREALAITRQHYADTDEQRLVRPLALLGAILVARGDWEQAEAALREQAEIWSTAHPAGHWRTYDAQGRLGEVLMHQNRYVEAEALLRDSHRRLRLELAADDDRTISAVHRLVELYEAWDKPDEAGRYRRLLPTAAPG
jgi:serine/threonine protein kinase/Tfp pilus assembly protein PilF